MAKKALTPAAAMEIKRLYALMDERGNRLYSQMRIGGMVGVSETTVFRVVHKEAAYAAVRELPTDDEAAASEARFRAANPQLFEQDVLAKMASAVAREVGKPAQVAGMLDELSSEEILERSGV